MTLRRAAIVSPIRTAVGKFGGALASVTAGDLGNSTKYSRPRLADPKGPPAPSFDSGNRPAFSNSLRS